MVWYMNYTNLDFFTCCYSTYKYDKKAQKNEDLHLQEGHTYYALLCTLPLKVTCYLQRIQF